MFITLAGIDGSGKTTLAGELAARICKYGHRVRLTREPGGSRVGMQIRSILLGLGKDPELTKMEVSLGDEGAWYSDVPLPLTETLLFSAARAQHAARIRQWLREGEVVVCDRFADCTHAYQGARGVQDDVLQALEDIATGGLTPDLTFLLDISPEDAAQRLFWSRHDRNAFDRQSTEFFARVRQNYRRIAERNVDRVIVLDANQSPEDMIETAWQATMQRMEGIEQMSTGQAGRPLEVRADVLTAIDTLAEQQDVVLLIDVMRYMEGQGQRVSRTTVQRAMHTPTDRFPDGYLTDDRRQAMRAEIWKRVNTQKAKNGNVGLQRQAAAGYPNLVKARQVRAENREENLG